MEKQTGVVLTSGEPTTDIGVWGALDQAVAVQIPRRDPMRAYIDGLTSAASQATAIKRLRPVARLVAVPDYAALPCTPRHNFCDTSVLFALARK
jgi:hypothetical protein